MRDRSAERQLLSVVTAQRPAEPSWPANLHVHGYALAGSQLLARSQAPVSDRDRQPLASGPERFDVLDCPTQRLYRHARQRR